MHPQVKGERRKVSGCQVTYLTVRFLPQEALPPCLPSDLPFHRIKKPHLRIFSIRYDEKRGGKSRPASLKVIPFLRFSQTGSRGHAFRLSSPAHDQYTKKQQGE